MAVDTEAVDQPIHVVYRYDRAGNRVGSSGDGSQYRYSYDANNRMRSAYDVEAGQAVETIDYDGFGNRTRESRGNNSTTYTYDKLNRVKTSSAGDTWSYDKVGNTLNHTWSGGYTRNTYDRESGGPGGQVSHCNIPPVGVISAAWRGPSESSSQERCTT